MIAKPTATSAAATAIMKKTKICPDGSDLYDENAANRRFTELSINSTDMKIMMALRRVNTPMIPIQKRAVLNQM